MDSLDSRVVQAQQVLQAILVLKASLALWDRLDNLERLEQLAKRVIRELQVTLEVRDSLGLLV